MSIRARVVSWLLCAVGMATLFCACSKPEKPPLRRITLRLNWTLEGDHAGFFLALDRGYYARQGLDVEIVPGSGSATTVKLVGNGNCPFGYADAATMVRGVSSGQPVCAVAAILQVSPMAVIYHAENPIKTPADLRGKRIGVTSGDAFGQLFPGVLKANGMSPSDVRIFSFPTPHAKEEAFLEGHVDAFFGYASGQPVRLRISRGIETGCLLFSAAGVNTLSNSIIVNRTTLREEPAIVARFMRATQEGFADMIADPDAAAEVLARHAGPSGPGVEIFRRQIEVVLSLLHTPSTQGHPVGWSAREDWQKTLELLSEYADFKGDLNPDAYYTNRFVSKKP